MLLALVSAVLGSEALFLSRPYFTVSDLRLPFSSPPTTRRVTVEVFDPASTRVKIILLQLIVFKVMTLHFLSYETYDKCLRTLRLCIQQSLENIIFSNPSASVLPLTSEDRFHLIQN
jgi:hypothetical protein